MLYYTQHARHRMRERRISEAEVEFCLEHPEISYADIKGNPVYIAYPQGRRIKVVIQANSIDPVIIITVAD